MWLNYMFGRNHTKFDTMFRIFFYPHLYIYPYSFNLNHFIPHLCIVEYYRIGLHSFYYDCGDNLYNISKFAFKGVLVEQLHSDAFIPQPSSW